MALKVKITDGWVCDFTINYRSRRAIALMGVISKYDCFQQTKHSKKIREIMTQLVGLQGRKQHDV